MSTYEALSIMLSILTLVVVLLIELIKKKWQIKTTLVFSGRGSFL